MPPINKLINNPDDHFFRQKWVRKEIVADDKEVSMQCSQHDMNSLKNLQLDIKLVELAKAGATPVSGSSEVQAWLRELSKQLQARPAD